jgi:hypothetical protein
MTKVEHWFLGAFSAQWPPKLLEDAWEEDWCVHKV